MMSPGMAGNAEADQNGIEEEAIRRKKLSWRVVKQRGVAQGREGVEQCSWLLRSRGEELVEVGLGRLTGYPGRSGMRLRVVFVSVKRICD